MRGAIGRLATRRCDVRTIFSMRGWYLHRTMSTLVQSARTDVLSCLEDRVHPVRQYPDAALRFACRPVTTATLEFALALGRHLEQLVERFESLGIAAPQIGVGLRVFAYRENATRIRTAINPVIQTSGPTDVDVEGCLSLGQMLVDVPRARCARMTAMDATGEIYQLDASRMWARVLLHENDHLNGVLMIDRCVTPALLGVTAHDPLLGYVEPEEFNAPRLGAVVCQAQRQVEREEELRLIDAEIAELNAQYAAQSVA